MNETHGNVRSREKPLRSSIVIICGSYFERLDDIDFPKEIYKTSLDTGGGVNPICD